MTWVIKYPRSARLARVMNLAARLERDGALVYDHDGRCWTTTDPDVMAQMRRAGAVVSEAQP